MDINKRTLRRSPRTHIPVAPQVVDPLPEWWATNQKAIHEGFSYCICGVKNHKHIMALIDDLMLKTTSPYEIILWVETLDAEFERYLARKIWAGAPIIVAERKYPSSVSMEHLASFCQRSWLMQINDDMPKLVSGYTPKVSIVLTTYRRPHILPRIVNNILSQDYQNWELIIVDNSPTREAVQLPNDPRIHPVYHLIAEHNACYSRNEGVKRATGDIVCNFDDDDEMLPGYLSKMAAPFADPKVQVARCGMLCTFGACDFSYSTQEAWLRRTYATPTWQKGTPIHDQLYYHGIINRNGWTRENIIQLGEVLVIAHEEPTGGRRTPGFVD